MHEQVFLPDWASVPGRTISDLVAARGSDVCELAASLSLSSESVADLLCGRLEIGDELATGLEAHLGSTKEFWIRREQDYRDSLALTVSRLLHKIKTPVADVRKFGWLRGFIRGDGDMAACARFLGISTADDFEEKYGELEAALSFRRSGSFHTQLGALAVWFRAGQMAASCIETAQWQPMKFSEALPKLRELTREKDPSAFLPELQRRCADAGVAVVVMRAPSGCPASGVTYRAPGKNPLVILSSRHLRDDHFWFSFFHEAGHVLLHGESLIVESTPSLEDPREEEANVFASAALIPPEFRNELVSLGSSRYAIVRFARKIGIAPGVIVGQLQHAGLLRHNQLNSLKRRYRWRANLEMG
ncbi:ImmA/IrrE family metallo-endopeptidase [Luteimonas sp. 22616]|uniref:ImmA/IrrE family metallo-endopeptidase n=1 Tax=Luteimonas sp. 22616 TaxID=3453951 RepID=UPI003F863834